MPPVRISRPAFPYSLLARYRALRRLLFRWVAAPLSDEQFIRLRYRLFMRRPLNTTAPQTFLEKVNWRILYGQTDALRHVSDKLAARQQALERVGPGYLPALYAVADDPRAIEWDGLPQSFTVKPTHGSGWVLPVPDRSALSCRRFLAVARGWLIQDFYRISREACYRGLPRRLMVEEYLGADLVDYKVYCCDGEPRWILTVSDRDIGIKMDWFTPAWERILAPYPDYPPSGIPRPPALDEMLHVARSLSQGYDLIRVDLYNLEGRVVFGEYTVNPGGGLGKHYPPEVGYQLGALWRLDTAGARAH
jgi:hypothetical protein